MEMISANEISAHVDYRILGVEFAVRLFIRLLNSRHVLDNIERAQKVDVHFGRIAYDAEHRACLALGIMNIETHTLYPIGKIVKLLF